MRENRFLPLVGGRALDGADILGLWVGQKFLSVPSGLGKGEVYLNGFGGQECPRSPIQDRQECLPHPERGPPLKAYPFPAPLLPHPPIRPLDISRKPLRVQ